jgi:hypothetical protein
MKNPFKSFTVFVIMILTIAFLSSCSAPSHGFNYSQHSKKGSKLSKQATKRNKGKSLTEYKCRGRH